MQDMPNMVASSAGTALAIGAVVLLTAWLPIVLRILPLSLPIVAVAAGYLFPPGRWLEIARQTPISYSLIEHVTEFVILISLMGAGLRIQRPLSWHRWRTTARLILLAMPLTIGAIALLGYAMIGLAWPAALLLGAVLAPTDPVLAAEVQAGAPNEEEGGEVRFALTSEAGLNDGLAFPFVVLSMTLLTFSWQATWLRWLTMDLLWSVGCGLAVGFAAGRIFGWLTFRLPRLPLSKTDDGLVAVGVTLISYALADFAHGYGYIAVFVAAVTLRAEDRDNEFHSAMADLSEQIERILMVMLMAAFGAALAAGVLKPLSWSDALLGLIVLLIFRPLICWLSLSRLPLPLGARGLISFFGIRGLGTFYYMAYAAGRIDLPQGERLWAIACFVVLVSVLIHGATSTPLMGWADRRRRAKAISPSQQPRSPDTSAPISGASGRRDGTI
ncbi:cation:proton antiporter [Mesorhizobium sp. SP-1A]|uniref:cation:proton antiporter n=1 Tax=Mesorhizobium sp. SP-1A TaxID=3077840 RepID=UPI0028F6E02B|nr:cation:proton antiporter [Mesorhizobium sp. SP-1A]